MHQIHRAVRVFRRWSGWLLLIWWTAQFIATHTPLPGDFPHHSDKLAHIAVYTMLGLLLTTWLYCRRQQQAWQSVLATLVIVSLYAIADEVTQPFVGRDASVGDVLADLVGILAGISAAVCSRMVWNTEGSRGQSA